MTKNKTALLGQMEQQRFLPITSETFQLYEAYSDMIDTHNPDELSYLLFYRGEYYFRIGNFNESLSHLSRLLQAPKCADLKYLDTLSYNIIGLIYAYLGQENIALNNFMQGKTLSEQLQSDRESAVCCVNLGTIYSRLEDFATAMDYYNTALSYIASDCDSSYNLSVLCEAYRGIIHCKLGEKEEALSSFQNIKQLREQYSKVFYDASVLDLNIRLFDFLDDKDFLKENLNLLLDAETPNMDFLELSEFYFDVLEYLLDKRMQKEALLVLDFIHPYVDASPLAFLKYIFFQYKVTYAQLFCSNDDYLLACSQLIALQADYMEEQRTAKLYSLEFVERLRQTKNDSEMYRQKSQLDQMTGLLNKYTIQFFVEEDLSMAQGDKQSAMILIDLDHFKQINDILGHLVGDSFICQTASIIQDYFKEKALCGRVGGDEFLVYLSNVTDISYVILQTEILRQEIYRQASERNITVTTQASIGIAFSSEYCYDYESLFSAADQALYRAKMEGRNKVVVAE